MEVYDTQIPFQQKNGRKKRNDDKQKKNWKSLEGGGTYA